MLWIILVGLVHGLLGSAAASLFGLDPQAGMLGAAASFLFSVLSSVEIGNDDGDDDHAPTPPA